MRLPVRIGEVSAGKYEVERPLAAGGMGIVVVARHRQLDKEVAIKFMLSELRHADVSPDALERFVREGRAAVKLRGENVARVIDVDTLPGGMPSMVMEYLEGVDLGQHVQKHGPLPIAEAVDYVLQACVAMAEAHLRGIVHRDLKPSNLFLTRRPDGSPLIKVLDFGISKLFEDVADGKQTQTAVIMGSPSYMPPEQAESSRSVDVRSDIWSLGVILYECTSKRLPYESQGSTAAMLAQLIYEDPRPLARTAPNLPARFCQVVDTCLQKRPDDRYQSIGELTTALLPFASQVGRAAAASVHAMLGGAERVAAPDGGAATAVARELAPQRERPQGAGEPLHAASTEPAGASPGAGAPARAAPGEGLMEIATEAVTRAVPLQLAVDVRRRADEAGGSADRARRRAGAAGSGRGWLGARRVVALGVAVVLGALSALVLVWGPLAWLDVPCDGLHAMGRAALDWAGEPWQLLGGPIFQLVIPLGLALFLSRFGQSLAASACVWWLGDNLVHIARSVHEGFTGPSRRPRSSSTRGATCSPAGT